MDIYAHLDDVCVRYGEKIVMQNLTLDVVEGAITCIIGLSGAGKSTILRLLNGLKKPDSGRVIVKGQDITEMRERDLIELRRSIGFAFQFSALFDSLTIGENVALPLREHTKMSDAEIRKLVSATLDSVGLAHVEERFPSELSGGMVKRAGFARAVVTAPQAVLYDEPTTGLDPIMADVINDLIVKCVREVGTTAVSITHDMVSARKIADRIAMLHEGRIVWHGPTAEIDHSSNPFVDQFINGRADGPIKMQVRAA